MMVSDPGARHAKLDRILGFVLLFATIGVYWHIRNNGFIYFDDPAYIYENQHVRSGLTIDGLFWAFQSFHAANWHPLTWLSHMLDCQLYGLNPAGHHLTGVFFHATNALLLFLFLREATGKHWQSFIVAGLFALHPLHVESVAWASERKDVLSAFFWMLTCVAYTRYAMHQGRSWYILSISCFGLGLMAKPMLVTLPFVLILLDFWPLGRMSFIADRNSSRLGDKPFSTFRFLAVHNHLLLEKTPFLVMTMASSIVTFLAQSQGGAVQSLELFPIKIRLLNAFIAYVSYIGKMFWPTDLAVLYVHPGNALVIWHAIVAAFFLILVCALAIRFASSQPYILVGWFWFLGTLLPVIGIVQVGAQSMADRYTYIPLIGLFIILVYGLSAVFVACRVHPLLRAVLVVVCFGTLIGITRSQIGYWKDSTTLFGHTLKVAGETAQFHYVVALEEGERGNTPAAQEHYDRAVELNALFMAQMHNEMGYRLAEAETLEEAALQFRSAIRIYPEFAKAHNNLGVVLGKKGCLEEALGEFSQALRLSPDYSQARINLDNALKEKASRSNSEALNTAECS
jgi:hypothetical protein